MCTSYDNTAKNETLKRQFIHRFLNPFYCLLIVAHEGSIKRNMLPPLMTK